MFRSLHSFYLPWGRNFTRTRSALVVVFGYDLLITLVYLSRGAQQLETGVYLVLMGVLKTIILFLFALELLVVIVKWIWNALAPFEKAIVKGISAVLVLFLGIPVIVRCTYDSHEHTVTLDDNRSLSVATVKTFADGNAPNILYVHPDTGSLVHLCVREGAYARCKFEQKGRGSYPVHEGSLMSFDKRVIAALREKQQVK
jgi:hypothetical protein